MDSWAYKDTSGTVTFSGGNWMFGGVNCTDGSTTTFNSSCPYPLCPITGTLGCTDSLALNYDSLATIDDGSCLYPVYGCTDSLALNYNPLATNDDGTCNYTLQPMVDLFFSEYAEGSSNNKYFEIYNPTANPVSLSGYTVYASGNGGSWTNSFTSNSTIASGDVYMIANSSLSSTVIGNADTTLSYPSIVHFNGDDALILMNGNDTIDMAGNITALDTIDGGT